MTDSFSRYYEPKSQCTNLSEEFIWKCCKVALSLAKLSVGKGQCYQLAFLNTLWHIVFGTHIVKSLIFESSLASEPGYSVFSFSNCTCSICKKEKSSKFHFKSAEADVRLNGFTT